jgi:glycosyltransferase involved in cell wall biosynthesis
MIIHAVSIHSGGGKVLLDQLLTEKTFGEVNVLICDTRYDLPLEIDNKIEIFRVEPTLFSRWSAEKTLKRISEKHPELSVLCFSNLPPAFKLKNKVILYLQNALLLPNIPFYADSYRARFRTMYEKMWLAIFWKNVDEIWVQTQWMKETLAKKEKRMNLQIKPIIQKLPVPNFQTQKKYDFITVSGSAPHKRLSDLLDAWELMPSPTPSLLIITDNPSPAIAEKLERLKDKNITVKVNLSRADIFRSYEESSNLIITSKIESYCLPVYEALHFHLKIIAPLEEYTREHKNNIQLIVPFNSESIVKCVRQLTK